MVKQSIWRYSYVRMYYSTKPNTDTPTPLCELRAFVYLMRKPASLLEERKLRADLMKAIDMLIKKDGLDKAFGQAIGRGSLTPDDKQYTKLEEIEIERLPTGKIKVRIDGFEREPIDIVEAKVQVENKILKHKNIKITPKKITYNYLFRYVAFFNEKGKIKGDYDEFDILKGALD